MRISSGGGDVSRETKTKPDVVSCEIAADRNEFSKPTTPRHRRESIRGIRHDSSKINSFNFHEADSPSSREDFALNQPLMQFAGGDRSRGFVRRRIDFWQRPKGGRTRTKEAARGERVRRNEVNKGRGKSANKGICTWKSVSLLILTGTCFRRAPWLNWRLGIALHPENIVPRFHSGLLKLATPFRHR